MKRVLHILFGLGSLFYLNKAYAQEYLIHSQFYGVEEGLSHRDVQCIHQDPQGFMWFGTKYGLNRFDGYNFKWFTSENDGLQSNEVNHILEDSDGLMWLIETGAFNSKKVKSITIFNPITHRSESIGNYFNNELPFSPEKINSFSQNQAGHLVFLTSDNLLITYINEFKVEKIDLGDYLLVNSITWNPKGGFWVTTAESNISQSLFLLSNRGEKLHQVQHPSSSYLFFYNANEDGSGYYFDFTINEKNKRLIKYYKVDSEGVQYSDFEMANKFSKFNLTHIGPHTQIKKNKDHYWVYTDDLKSQVFSTKEEKTILLHEQYPNLKLITDIFFDNNQTTWISTQFGIYHFELRPSYFRKYLYQQKSNGYSSDFACRGIKTDSSGQLWTIVENQLSIWKVNLETNQQNLALRTGGTRYGLGKNRNGHLLYTEDLSFIQYDPQTNETIKKIHLFKNVTKELYTWSIHEDKTGKVWIDGNGKERTIGYVQSGNFKMLPNWFGNMGDQLVYQFLENDSDTAWLATSIGLITIDLRTGTKLQHYWHEGTGNNFFPYDHIHHIHRDSDYKEAFWLATSGNGLVLWHPIDGILKRYTRADGLPNNTLYAIYEDDQKNFWMSSDNGIVYFNKKSNQFKGYTIKDGITHNEFNRLSHHQDNLGNIYFGGLNGITAFHPKDFYLDTIESHPLMVITDFQQFDGKEERMVDRKIELQETNNITIKPNDRYFHIGFALLTFYDIKNVRYAYQIEGFDKDWNYQKENTLRFSRLPFGHYKLHVKGQSSNGQWSENEIQLHINVIKPTYLQNWFLLLTGFTIILIGVLLYNFRTSQLKRRQAELEKLVGDRTKKIQQDKKVIEHQAEELKSLEQLKSRFFANVSHELRTPLTLMLGPINSLLKRNNKNETEKKLLTYVQRNGQQLQKLINEILDLSKLENNKLEVNEEAVAFHPYLKEQLAQFHSFAASDKLKFEFEYSVDHSLVLLLDKSKFEKIIHNFLSNAMKFTSADGTVKLKVEEINDKLQLSISDTGNGIHPDDLPHIFDRFYQSKQTNAKTEGGTGIGLSLCKELAGLLSGQVWVESELGKGSIFYFRFPKKVAGNTTHAGSHPLAPHEGQLPESMLPSTYNLVKDNKSLMARSVQERGKGDEIKLPSRQASILIVEDNSDLRDFLQFLLSDYQVFTAENGKEALTFLHSKEAKLVIHHSPFIIISDLMMPVMDGYQLLEKLKSEDRWRHIPVIMLTAKVNVSAKLKALRIGVDDYLTKPFQEEELIARIENLLRNYKERMEHFSSNEEQNVSSIKSNKPVIAQVDAQWLEELENIFKKKLPETSFKMEEVGTLLNLSQRQVGRRLQQLTGLLPKQYLQEMRLQQARSFILEGKYATIKEVSFAVGFKDPKYFSKIFQVRFGISPSAVK